MGLLAVLFACSSPGPQGFTVWDSTVGAADVPDRHDRSSAISADLAVAGMIGNRGTAAWLTSLPAGLEAEDIVIQALRSGKWFDVCVGSSQCFLTGKTGRLRAVSSDGRVRSHPVPPVAVVPTLAAARADASFYVDESLDLQGAVDLPDGVSAGSFISREVGGVLRWWSPDEGWVASPQPVDLDDLAITSLATHVTDATLTLMVGLPAADWDVVGPVAPSGVLGLATVELSVLELGHAVLWGDPHVHTDLSHDGCEDPDGGCAGPDLEPAADTFANAQAQGLDWMAMTDHAEFTTYVGSDGAAEIDIWERQNAVVQEAAAALEAGEASVIPFLGYEFTLSEGDMDGDGYRTGGHRTVIFEETAACKPYRVGAGDSRTFVRGWSDTVLDGDNPVYARSPGDWRVAVARAIEACGEQRLLFMAHHPSLMRPQPVDWRVDANIPDPNYETLVEIASEHGTSECYDIEAPHCDFRLSDGGTHYFEEGSYQAALMAGFELGVAGGTDAHDAQGGSTDDGPSCTSIVMTDGSLGCQPFQGAATGVLVESPYDRSAVMDGMFARRTAATTGPRLPVRAWLTADGQHYLPGRSVTLTDDATITVSLAGLYDPDVYGHVEIDLLSESGERVAGVDGAVSDDDALLQHALEEGDCSACYVRIRLYEDADDDEGERIWLSPWFL